VKRNEGLPRGSKTVISLLITVISSDVSELKFALYCYWRIQKIQLYFLPIAFLLLVKSSVESSVEPAYFSLLAREIAGGILNPKFKNNYLQLLCISSRLQRV
jgi:hypothetical protein